MYGKENVDAIIQNLRDAGCGIETIDAFLESLRADNVVAGLKLLNIHRRALLDQLHKDQRQIDCVDYLVYTLKKANT